MQDSEELKLRAVTWQAPIIQRGPLINMLQDLTSSNLKSYKARGGFSVLGRHLSENKQATLIDDLNEAGLKGRGGGGFPAAHKWWLVHRKQGEKYFVCNGNTGHPGNMKDQVLLETSPYALVEAALLAAWTVGAKTAFICVPGTQPRALKGLAEAAKDAHTVTDLVSAVVVPTYGNLIIGEETALLELLEGKLPQPRAKPALPTEKGLFGCPTLVNNVETMMHAFLIAREGAVTFRSVGSKMAPGTMIFSLSGHIMNPGIYELPLGTSLKELIDHYAGGPRGKNLEVVFPAGPTSAPIKYASCEIPLDYESMTEAGSELGTGNIIVLDNTWSMVQITTRLAEYFQRHSCGKCQPCSDGTSRLVTMLYNLDRIDESSIDFEASRFHKKSLRLVNESASQPVRGASLTDMKKGIDKIDALCHFFKYRGDCSWSEAAAKTIQKSLSEYREFFEQAKESSVIKN